MTDTSGKRGALRRMLALVLACALALPLTFSGAADAASTTQQKIDALKQQSADLSQQRKDIKAKLDSVRAEKGDLMDQKALLEDDIDLIQQQINNIQSQINSLDKEIEKYTQLISEKQAELEEAEAEEAELYELFCQRVREMEEGGEVSYWSILFSSADFSDLLDNFMMVEEFIEYDNKLMDDILALQTRIEAEKAALEEVRAQQEEAKAQQEAAKKEQEAAKADLKAQESEVQKLIDQVSATESELAAQEAELKKAAAAADAQIKKLEQELAPKIASVKSEGSFAWPLPGYTTLTSLFGGRIDPITGKRASHTGIDIPAPTGTPIKCAKSGVVTVSVKGTGGYWSYGNYVVVSHSDGTSTLYAHMSSRAVKQGQTVSQGTVLGYVGVTGRTTGAHLHFEVRINGSRTDPAKYFSNLYYRSSGKTVKLN